MPIDLPHRGNVDRDDRLARRLAQLETDMVRVLRRLPDVAGSDKPPQIPGLTSDGSGGGIELYLGEPQSNVSRGATVNVLITAALNGTDSGTVSVTDFGLLRTGDIVNDGSTCLFLKCGNPAIRRFLIYDCNEMF